MSKALKEEGGRLSEGGVGDDVCGGRPTLLLTKVTIEIGAIFTLDLIFHKELNLTSVLHAANSLLKRKLN